MKQMNEMYPGWYGCLGIPVRVTTSKYLVYEISYDRAIKDVSVRHSEWVRDYYIKIRSIVFDEIKTYLLERFPNNRMKHPFGMMTNVKQYVCRIDVWEPHGEIYSLCYTYDSMVYKPLEQIISEIKDFIASNIKSERMY